MKFAVCALKSRDLNCFGKPIFDERSLVNIKTTFVRSLKQGLVIDEKPTRLKYKNAAFYHIANYDDETGTFETIEPVCICDCNKVLEPQEVEVDGNYKD